jgi:circadian clock protein KaiC
MNTTPPRLSTGIEGLDDVLNGGLPANRVYLVQGDPGVGKTTLALQFLLEGRRLGQSTLYVSLSETEPELRAVAASHGWSLEGINLYEMSAVEAAQIAQDEENTLYVPAEVELGERIQDLLAEVDSVRPSRVVIDSCSELRLLAQTPLRFRRQLLALKADLIRRDCTLLLLENPPSKGGDVLLQSLVHGVIDMEQLAPLYGAERRRLRVGKLREIRFRGGYHDFTIVGGGIQVFPRLVAAEHRADFSAGTLSSGPAELDALLGGGLDRGTSTLFMGPAGTGKSSVATSFAVTAARRGERAAIFAFDEGKQTLIARAAAMGMSLETPAVAGKVTVQQVDPAELAPGHFAHIVRSVVADGTRLIVIDSLNGYMNAMVEEQHVLLQLHELLSFLAQRGVVTILVMAQHGLFGSAAAPVDVSYLADTVVLLRYFEAAGRIRKALSVVKKRTGAHEDTIREFSLSARGVTVGPALESFSGVLTGAPVFSGDAGPAGPLLGRRDGH